METTSRPDKAQTSDENLYQSPRAYIRLLRVIGIATHSSRFETGMSLSMVIRQQVHRIGTSRSYGAIMG